MAATPVAPEGSIGDLKSVVDEAERRNPDAQFHGPYVIGKDGFGWLWICIKLVELCSGIIFRAGDKLKVGVSYSDRLCWFVTAGVEVLFGRSGNPMNPDTAHIQLLVWNEKDGFQRTNLENITEIQSVRGEGVPPYPASLKCVWEDRTHEPYKPNQSFVGDRKQQQEQILARKSLEAPRPTSASSPAGNTSGLNKAALTRSDSVTEISPPSKKNEQGCSQV